MRLGRIIGKCIIDAFHRARRKKTSSCPSHRDVKKNRGEREMNLMNMIKLLLSFECCTSTRIFSLLGFEEAT